MPERLGKLLETVRELESELAALESMGPQSMDPKTRAALECVVSEIGQALGRGGAGGQIEEPQSLMEKLRESAVGFESSHPTLSGIIERTINALGQLGI